MAGQDFERISTGQLKQRLARAEPDNRDPAHGYALVNVLDGDAFQKEHIPASINIPLGEEEEFERRFRRGKEVIVYCGSEDCDASPSAASALAERGFSNVKDYAAGMRGWKEAGERVESGGPS